MEIKNFLIILKRRLKLRNPKKNLYNGFFITFEGIEGVGKSTHQNKLTEFLKNKNLKVITTKEPGGTAIGNQIRKIILNPKNKKLFSLTELLLFMADRAQHIKEIIIPNLLKGHIVISDRYIDSTIAYQSAGRNLNKNIIKKLNDLTINNAMPDLTFLLDADLNITLKKAKTLSKEYKGGDRIEQESIKFHKKIKKEYNHLLRIYPNRIVKIKILGDINQTQQIIQKICLDKLKKVKYI